MTDPTELRRLLEDATPVPWKWQMGDPAMGGHHWQVRREGVPGLRMTGYTYGGRDDELAVAAVNALPELLDDLAKARGHRDSLATALLEVQREKRHLVEALEQLKAEPRDEYHTMAELYEYRMLYNAAAFNAWCELNINDVHKSWRHSDGEECFGGGWFVVVAQLPTGQITNHYKAKHWDQFRIPERKQAAPWDEHTAELVARRLHWYNERSLL